MFGLDGNMKFINISQDYIRALHDACPEVYYKPSGYENKPYMGIMINEENRSYVIPLSSAKEKHKSWKNINRECYLVYEYASKNKLGSGDIWVDDADGNMVKHILSIIDIKKMIPIRMDVCTEVNLNKDVSDTLDEIRYKDLLNKEYAFCLKIIDELIRKANKLYENQMNTGKIKMFCCDFRALEQVCDTYEEK